MLAGDYSAFPDCAEFICEFIVRDEEVCQRFISHSNQFFAEVIGKDFQVTEVIMLSLIFQVTDHPFLFLLFVFHYLFWCFTYQYASSYKDNKMEIN